MVARRTKSSPEVLDRLREEMEQRRSAMDAIKIAYMNSTPFRDRVPEYSDVRLAAEQFIQSSYEYQKARFGKIQVKLSVSNLLR